jgi:hypothetical protein
LWLVGARKKRGAAAATELGSPQGESGERRAAAANAAVPTARQPAAQKAVVASVWNTCWLFPFHSM